MELSDYSLTRRKPNELKLYNTSYSFTIQVNNPIPLFQHVIIYLFFMHNSSLLYHVYIL